MRRFCAFPPGWRSEGCFLDLYAGFLRQRINLLPHIPRRVGSKLERYEEPIFSSGETWSLGKPLPGSGSDLASEAFCGGLIGEMPDCQAEKLSRSAVARRFSLSTHYPEADTGVIRERLEFRQGLRTIERGEPEQKLYPLIASTQSRRLQAADFAPRADAGDELADRGIVSERTGYQAEQRALRRRIFRRRAGGSRAASCLRSALH
jgi:hypothetical protein